MNRFTEIEVRALYEVIAAVDARLAERAAQGHKLTVPRAKIYAAVLYAVIVSARDAGHHGAGSLASAPLLDVILNGAEATDWDTAIVAAIMDFPALN
ncbi:hypothetical protein [Nocardia amamiensis]|uniref:hypothetical protein n=1 Tax=Nocardia amamiensis TaxID=404578 RepID=UPI00082F1902|nr:hypothetical protein [Nocardia amamiensis]